MVINRKMVNTLLRMIILLTSPFSSAMAMNEKQASASISGEILGLNKGKKDTLNIVVTKSYNLFGSVIMKVPIAVNGSFRFKTELLDNVTSLTFSINGSNETILNGFVEPGDNIYIKCDLRLQHPKLEFFGNNIAKFHCLDSLEQEYENFVTIKSKNWKNVKYVVDLDAHYLNYFSLFNSGYNRSIEILNTYRPRLSADMYKYLMAKYTARYLIPWHLNMQIALEGAIENSRRARIRAFYQTHTFSDYNKDNNIAYPSENYLQYILYKSNIDLFINGNGEGLDYKAVYDQLKNSYNGKLRDCLLTYFFYDFRSLMNIRAYTNSDMEACLDDAYAMVQDPYLKVKISEKFRLKKGSEVFNFKLPDTNGKMVELKDLKGKVILLDVWAEGCTGCAVFSQMFHKNVYPQVKDDPNFIMVSINVNPTKNGWIRGINSGKYTTKHQINLFTEGKILEHPFSKYYSIRAIPFILLIDRNGKIYSKIEFSTHPDILLKSIKEALAEKG